MRVRAYYKAYIEPLHSEDITDSKEYRDDNIPIILSDITKTKEAREVIKGLKEVEYRMIAKVGRDRYDKMPNDIKVKDRVFFLNNVYDVDRIEEVVPDKMANKIARNPSLYNRYVEKVLVLK